jgi:ketosteroid isomerase-like protein
MDANPSADDAVQVKTLITSWAAAVRRKDLPGILRNHSPDILMFDVPVPMQSRGIEAYEHTWDVFFAWSHDPVKFDIVEMHVTVGADVAFVTALMRCSGHEPNGQDIELDFRLTVGLEKRNRQWIVVHEHHSIPAER